MGREDEEEILMERPQAPENGGATQLDNVDLEVPVVLAIKAFIPSPLLVDRVMRSLCLITLLFVVSVFFFLSPATSTKVASQDDGGGAAAAEIYRWQRTGFHFQPKKNWMNDPNGPLFYKGFYHLFYQYNPYSASWGNITWGHAVSTDLVRWRYLEPALVPDQWYDIKGVWTGSATMVNGKPVLIYTGANNELVQLQNKAVPADPHDPLLTKWVKARENPVAVPPRGVNGSDFRDPVTAWIGHDGNWRLGIGSKLNNTETGLLLQYESKDFVSWKLLEEPLHSSEGTGMWECPDFYPVATKGKNGVSHHSNSKEVKYVVKASTQGNDVYVVGDYDRSTEKFKPSVEELDIGTSQAMLYDHGIYYASKTFYDPKKDRRIVWGWIREDDAPADDIAKGWASVQAIPRQIWLDETNHHALKQWPVDEVDSLRTRPKFYENLRLHGGMEAKTGKGSQLDIEVTFDVSEHGIEFSSSSITAEDALMHCNGSLTSSETAVLGPFGVKVLASDNLLEQTSIFFKLVRFDDGWKTLVCKDLSRSSLAADATKEIYGSAIQVSEDENVLSMRIIVDHSIVETFAQGGRASITARVYPQLVDENNANLFVFNNGTKPVKLKKLNVWQMKEVHFPTI